MVGPRDITRRDEMAVRRLTELQQAFDLVKDALHRADGTQMPSEHQAHEWSGQDAVTASIYLDIAQMFAERVITRR